MLVPFSITGPTKFIKPICTINSISSLNKGKKMDGRTPLLYFETTIHSSMGMLGEKITCNTNSAPCKCFVGS